jgi:hypothetical protein
MHIKKAGICQDWNRDKLESQPGIVDARDIAFKQGGNPKLPSYQLKYLCLHSFRHSCNKWHVGW